MKVPGAAPATVRVFTELLPDDPRVTVRKLFGQPAAFVQGNLFLGVFGRTIFVRLGPEDRAEAERSLGMRPFTPMEGHAMTEYRVLPDELLEDLRGAAEWVDRAIRWTGTLPPKSVARRPARPRSTKARPTRRGTPRRPAGRVGARPTGRARAGGATRRA